MTVLTNNFSLLLKVVNNNSPARKIEVPKGSKISYVRSTSSYHAYYEIHVYKLYCLFEGLELLIPCSTLPEGKEPKVDCVKENLHHNKKYYWSAVFNEPFPA
jgi:hypothetical protein